MRHFLYITALLFIILCSCNKVSKNNIDNQIAFDTIHTVKVYHINNDSTQPSYNLTMDYIYPISIQDSSVLKKLQRNFNKVYLEDDAYVDLSADSAVSKYIANSVKRFDEDIRTYYDNPGLHEDIDVYLSYYDKIKGDILFNKNEILSFQVSRFINKGKATNTTFYNYVFNLQTGELIHEDDIFNPYFESEMTPLILSKILTSNKVKTVADLTDIGYLQDIEEIIPNRNFSVDDKGITYIFNRGEYAALPLNEIRVFFTYEELKPFLKENSIISSLIGQ